MKYRVLLRTDEDGIFVAEVPDLPGCISDGRNKEEAMRNIREAVQLYLEDLRITGDPVPPPAVEESVEV